MSSRTPSTSPSIDELAGDPHPALAAIRRIGPIGWVEALGGWMVVGYHLAVEVMRDADTFTVDDARFSTSQVVGSSMLSTDGDEHSRHRQPFVSPFTARSTVEHFADFVGHLSADLVAALAPQGEAELRSAVAAPLATRCMQRALGLEDIPVDQLLGWYRAIVQAVGDVTAGKPLPEGGPAAYEALTAAVRSTFPVSGGDSFLGQVASAAGALTTTEMLSDTAVLLFGGIETTEGMIANLLFHLLRNPPTLAAVRADSALLDVAVEESLRLEPAAAVVDRYATRDIQIGGADVRRNDLVMVSLAGANRDPGVFADPDTFDPSRPRLRRQLAFAQGTHTCLGLHLARLEARSATRAVLALPGLELDSERTMPPAGLVFRKPPTVWARWRS